MELNFADFFSLTFLDVRLQFKTISKLCSTSQENHSAFFCKVSKTPAHAAKIWF